MIPTGSLSYLEFMAPGILAQSVLFAAIFYGIAVIWERDLGIVHKLLVSPASRSSLVVGKAIAAGARGLVQGVLVVAIALVMGVRVRTDLAGAHGTAHLLGGASRTMYRLQPFDRVRDGHILAALMPEAVRITATNNRLGWLHANPLQ